jgi:hypothetical protein
MAQEQVNLGFGWGFFVQELLLTTSIKEILLVSFE